MYNSIPIKPNSSLRIFLTLLPFLEIAGFIIVGKAIGVLMTLLLIIASSMLGISILRNPIMLANWRLQQQGRYDASVEQMLHLTGRMLAGFLLLIPGFITDIIGLLLLNHWVRSRWIAWVLAKNMVNIEPKKHGETQGNVIEGEFWTKDDRKNP